jgi:hypothetical protein
MEKLFLILLSGYGLTMIITKGNIFKQIRERITTYSMKLGIFISCPQCVGLYCGVLLSLFCGVGIKYCLIYGFAVSGVGYTINKK